jgi:hypothetical protein
MNKEALKVLNDVFGVNNQVIFLVNKDELKLLKEAVEKATLDQIDQLSFLTDLGDLGVRLNFLRNCLEGKEGVAKELEAWEWCKFHVPGFNRKVQMIDPD